MATPTFSLSHTGDKRASAPALDPQPKYRQVQPPPRAKGETRSWAGILLGIQARQATALHVLGKLFRFLYRGDSAAFAARKRGFRPIDCHQYFQPAALALLPQGKSFLHGVFLVPKTSAFNGLADKRFLIRGELHFHR